MSTSPFPDVNVWLALAHRIHPHHATALDWALSVNPSENFCLCRFTQLGLLRLLTNRGAMSLDVLTQSAAWEAFDRLAVYWRTKMVDEPAGLGSIFRQLTTRDEISTRHWADAYLTAFAELAGLQLVTFDKALAARTKGSILLKQSS